MRHVVAAALSIAFVPAVEAVTHLERGLGAVRLRDVVDWRSWAIAGRYLLLGAVLLVVVPVSPRLP